MHEGLVDYPATVGGLVCHVVALLLCSSCRTVACWVVMSCAVSCALLSCVVHSVLRYAMLCCAVSCCSGPDAAPADLPSSISQLLTSAVTSGDAETAAYWAYHLARTGFFTATVSTVFVWLGQPVEVVLLVSPVVMVAAVVQ